MKKVSAHNLAAKKIILFLIASVLLLFSCKTGKPLNKVENEVRIQTPFSENQYRSDVKFIRAVYSHEGEDIAQDKTRAIMKAQLAIAQNASSLIKSYLKDYAAECKIVNTELQGSYQSIGEIWTRERLTNCNIIGEELYKNKKTGLYTYWVAMEMSRDELYKKTVNHINADEHLRQDFEESRFRKIFDNGIKEIEKENQQ